MADIDCLIEDKFVEVSEISLDSSTDERQKEEAQEEEVSGCLPDAPYFVVRNLVFEKELDYFLAETGLPVYFEENGRYSCLGSMKPVLSSIFRADFLGTDISFVNSQGEILDLGQPENLYRFITIEGGNGSQWTFLGGGRSNRKTEQE